MTVIVKSHHGIVNILLHGEKDMYERIVHDCEKSSLLWYIWYDKSFNIPCNGQDEMQIDFLLICQEGAIVVEVKGGCVEVIRGFYYYSHKGILTEMKKTPFKQANDYKWALLNNGVLNKDMIVVDYVCAFPHSNLNRTSDNKAEDLSYKLWNKIKQDSTDSFADFCLDVIRRNKCSPRILTNEELDVVVNSLAPSIEDSNKYSLTSLKEVLDWLHIDNLSTLEGLRKNPRLLIEGGPGTGKTTMAKAYIKRHSGLKGLYLCWTGLLASKVKLDLDKERINSCAVETFNNYVNKITNSVFDIQSRFRDVNFKEDLQDATKEIVCLDYDYIIIDEAQDVADKGLDVVLSLLCPNKNGLKKGRYLVFYDLEQGYNNLTRNLDETFNQLLENAACYILDENKRVPTNKLIVEYANRVLTIDHTKEAFESFLKILKHNNIPGLSINIFENIRDIKRRIKDHTMSIKQSRGDLLSTTLLIHSDLKDKEREYEDSVYDSISEMDLLILLSDQTIERKSKESLAFTSILKYKGLEDNNIILVLPYSKIKSSWDNFLFEIYVGMTRAIMNLDIFILKDI